MDWMNEMSEQWPQLVSASIVLLLGFGAYLLVSRMLSIMERKTYLESTLVASLRVMLRWIFVILILAAMLQSLGILTQFWAAATAMVTLVAIGFVAVWSVLSNVLCSIILLATRPFKIGQRMELPPDDLGGIVTEVTLLHTTLRADDGSTLQIPNNMFFQRVRRIRPPGYVPPRADKSAATLSDQQVPDPTRL